MNKIVYITIIILFALIIAPFSISVMKVISGDNILFVNSGFQELILANVTLSVVIMFIFGIVYILKFVLKTKLGIKGKPLKTLVIIDILLLAVNVIFCFYMLKNKFILPLEMQIEKPVSILLFAFIVALSKWVFGLSIFLQATVLLVASLVKKGNLREPMGTP